MAGPGTLIIETAQDKVQIHVKSASPTRRGYQWHATNNPAYEGGLLVFLGYNDTAYHNTVATNVPSFAAVMPAPGRSGPEGMSYGKNGWTKIYKTNWTITTFDSNSSLGDQLHSFVLKSLNSRSKVGKRMRKTSIEEARWECAPNHRIELSSLFLFNLLAAEPAGARHVEFASPLEGNHDAVYLIANGSRVSVQFKGGSLGTANVRDTAGVWAGLKKGSNGEQVPYEDTDFDELTVTYKDEERWMFHWWTFTPKDLDGSRLGLQSCSIS